MGQFRDMKRNARRQLHATLGDTVLYLSDRTAAPVVITARLHLNFAELGDLANVRVGFADRQEMTPVIVFMNDQVKPRRDGYVVTEDMGVFKIENDLPPDDITTKAEVTEVLPETAIRYGWTPSAPWCGFPAPGSD